MSGDDATKAGQDARSDFFRLPGDAVSISHSAHSGPGGDARRPKRPKH